jgi:hypothetical protein
MIDAAHDRPETALAALVARWRVRGGFVLFVRYSAVACALALSIIAAMRIIRPDEGYGLLGIALAAIVGLAFGAVAAWRRRPSAHDVGARIDRHLHLEDTVVAAIQVQHSTAGVGPLIVRQAVARARDVDASDIFPLDLGRPAAALGVAAVLLFVATLPGNSAPGSRAAGRAASGDGGTSAAAPAPEGDKATTQPATRSHAARGGETVVAPASQGRSAAAPDSTRSTGETASAGNDDRQQRDDATPSAAAQSNDTAGGERGAPGRGATGAAGSARKGPGSADVSVRADSKGGGGAGAGGARGAGSGGVRGDALLAPSDIALRAPVAQQPSERYEARRRAEAAVARGDIPPELRSYVREYFRAITR